MLEEAINYPRSGEDAFRTIIIGGILLLFGWLIIPALLVLGYGVRVFRSTFAGEEVPPEFDEWGEMFVDGVKAFVIGFVYLLIPAIIVGISFGGVIASALAGNGEVGVGAISGAFVGFSLAFILSLIAWYALPAAIANFVRRDRMGAAFSWADLRHVLFSGTYAKAWLFALAVFIGGGIVAGVVNIVPLIGFVVAAFVNFYVIIAADRLYAQGFDDAMGMEPAPEAPTGQPTA
jgi:hypothetical protein